MKAFITGSRAYGVPTKDSDIDLVVLVSEATAHTLTKLAGGKEPVRFGKLNLILCTDEAEFAIWKLGTESLQLSGPHDKYIAKEVFNGLRALVEVEDRAQSGDLYAAKERAKARGKRKAASGKKT